MRRGTALPPKEVETAIADLRAKGWALEQFGGELRATPSFIFYFNIEPAPKEEGPGVIVALDPVRHLFLVGVTKLSARELSAACGKGVDELPELRHTRRVLRLPKTPGAMSKEIGAEIHHLLTVHHTAGLETLPVEPTELDKSWAYGETPSP